MTWLQVLILRCDLIARYINTTGVSITLHLLPGKQPDGHFRFSWPASEICFKNIITGLTGKSANHVPVIYSTIYKSSLHLILLPFLFNCFLRISSDTVTKVSNCDLILNQLGKHVHLFWSSRWNSRKWLWLKRLQFTYNKLFCFCVSNSDADIHLNW